MMKWSVERGKENSIWPLWKVGIGVRCQWIVADRRTNDLDEDSFKLPRCLFRRDTVLLPSLYCLYYCILLNIWSVTSSSPLFTEIFWVVSLWDNLKIKKVKQNFLEGMGSLSCWKDVFFLNACIGNSNLGQLNSQKYIFIVKYEERY